MAEFVTLKKNDGTIIYPQIDPNTIDFSKAYYPGQFLVVARNTETLSWYGTTATIWGNGVWTQYGPMAASSYKYRLKINNTTSKTMTVILELSCPTLNIGDNVYASTFIWEVDSNNSKILNLANSILSNKSGQYNLWVPVYLRKIVTIAPNSTKYFVPAVYTSNNVTCRWLGGDTTTNNQDTSFGGDSCIFSAKLLSLA